MHAHDTMFPEAVPEAPIGARLRTPEERRDLAHEALTRNGYAPAETHVSGATIYRPDPTVPPVTQRGAFATFTLASAATARAIRVNPRHVMHVALYRGHVGAETTQITFTDGSAQLVTESVEDVVAQLEAALEAVAA